MWYPVGSATLVLAKPEHAFDAIAAPVSTRVIGYVDLAVGLRQNTAYEQSLSNSRPSCRCRTVVSWLLSSDKVMSLPLPVLRIGSISPASIFISGEARWAAECYEKQFRLHAHCDRALANMGAVQTTWITGCNPSGRLSSRVCMRNLRSTGRATAGAIWPPCPAIVIYAPVPDRRLR